MTKLVTTVVVAIAVICVGLPMLLIAAVGMSAGTDACAPTITVSPAAGEMRLDPDQTAIAHTIIDVGVTKGVPRWGWIIAIATALQESGLRNLPDLGAANDHDSIGVFQQRPSQGWGTPTQLADPAYQAGTFYDTLLTVPGWQTMPLTQAAQAVQRSAFPNRYARWTDTAISLVNALSDTFAACATHVLDHLPPEFNLPANTPPAVVTAILWALGQLGTPYSFGGDCTAPHSGDPTRQCDCSSLVQAAYRAAGITIPRVTADQTHAGTPVPAADRLMPGDLILIPGSDGTMTHPGHVGLYLGQGWIIHAPYTGTVVQIVPLDSWRDQIATIRRFAS